MKIRFGSDNDLPLKRHVMKAKISRNDHNYQNCF